MTTTKTLGQSPTTLALGVKNSPIAAEQQVTKPTNTPTAPATAKPAKFQQDVFQTASAAPTASGASKGPGGLKVDDKGVITTAGGYKIECTGQFDWKISGPDGKETRIWGDPHVSEGDGGEWMFKRNSTFMLGDGTRIDVTTKPYGNGATVTGSLGITSGTDRLQVTDIDKGKGKVGEITHDGLTHIDDFEGDDVFAMGAETDDWTFLHREITGSQDQGETFEIGTQHKDWGFKEPPPPTYTGSERNAPTATAAATASKPGKPSDAFVALTRAGNTQNQLADIFASKTEQSTTPAKPKSDVEEQRRRALLGQQG